eukprot:TRINITY_DN13827_c0_g1_i2.p3 TRINITY_DN13827_c0_g1~~TRINITY_DN13827_c0_g1_i2.p3  ORF type:complete len:103 (-),score=27.99 TRINITY_DN13827_c0_g1_i2:108-416(-)
MCIRDRYQRRVHGVHPAWSGPCEMMFSTYQQLAMSIDDFDKRVDIILLQVEKLVEYKNEKITDVTCRPKFLFFMEGKIKDEIQGANIPALIEKVNKHIPLAY